MITGSPEARASGFTSSSRVVGESLFLITTFHTAAILLAEIQDDGQHLVVLRLLRLAN
jgi:hypothetical protein